MKPQISLPLGLFLALIINLLLFFAIQKLVQPDHSAFSLPELVTMVDFIRLKKEDQTPEPKLHEQLPDRPKPPEKPPPPPKQERLDPEKPKPEKIKPPTPEVKLPIDITGGPHLGEYLRKPVPRKIVQPTAPVPEPIVEPDPEPIVEQVAEPVETPVKTVESAPVEPQEPSIETDVVPTYRSNPKYPPRAMRAGITGVVTVEFTITSKGTVTDPVIIKSDPPKIFDKSVLRSIKRWKFKPKVVNGKPVTRRARQDINFNLK